MDEQTAAPARLTAWDVAAVLELAAAEVRATDVPAPTWDEALERVRAARARCSRRKIRIARRETPGQGVVSIPFA
jgi:hypothetical protein